MAVAFRRDVSAKKAAGKRHLIVRFSAFESAAAS
jgi:hypothetical protein